MKTEEFSYDLPKELIAQTPLAVRHNSRLLVFDRIMKTIQHKKFTELIEFLTDGDILVINKTKVIPARIFANKETGGKVEVLLLKKINEYQWQSLVGGKRIFPGKKLLFPNGVNAEVKYDLGGSERVIEFNRPIADELDEIGQMPLPPYIHERLKDSTRYQTVYAEKTGSAAAPTAGLHFTDEVFRQLKEKGVQTAEITLHVGLDTFAPVTEENIEDHIIHSEWCEIDMINAEKINNAKAGRKKIIAVGTTTVRTLESAACENGVKPFSGSTNLFITPGYHFKVVDCMLTNFHLPQSTLLMLVSAFAGKENIMKCYKEAIQERYRFYSFGDAMFII